MLVFLQRACTCVYVCARAPVCLLTWLEGRKSSPLLSSPLLSSYCDHTQCRLQLRGLHRLSAGGSHNSVGSLRQFKVVKGFEALQCVSAPRSYSYLQEFPWNAGNPPQWPHSAMGKWGRSQKRIQREGELLPTITTEQKVDAL